MIYGGKKINNILFDLGDVIIDISIPATISKFAERSGLSTQQIHEIYYHSEIFLNYEKGILNDQQFFEATNQIFSADMSFVEFKKIWNGMLLRIPQERLFLLDRVSKHYRTFLLSNTNNLHLLHFTEMMKEVSPGRPLESYFERAYYSHQMGMRKPDAEIFEFILNQNDLRREETLFLDDNVDNIYGAAQVGISALLIKSPSQLFEIFK